ncbi:NAD(P)H-dependent oxidoreductase [Thermococcus argininiproducens]|uniref:NAD(P)H-dependent oxidoreductase n=1 Tax=Thermococcus argininiproducens TaxID=2866384 RepID=A0A9E7M9K1_9EURY|nr:NAD(P)H-dependent oxidoreductase [Thermococcus argininiproducens]USG99538.1 NAD(P)H-dependent oxidoreductase [Thermococcus argininiproducens]
MKLLALCCSPRREGNTSKALSLLFEKLPKDWQKEMINLYEFDIKACGELCSVDCLKGEDVCKVDALDERVKLLEKLKTADIIVIGTPTYNMDVPSKLRALLERNYLENYLRNKVVALLIVSNLGGVKALCTLTSSLILDAQAIIACAVIVPGYREEGKTINDSKTQMLVDYLAKRIVEVVSLMH